MRKTRTWCDYLNDLDKLYKRAIKDENVALALKIKEAQIKIHQNEVKLLENMDAQTLSNAHIDQIITCLETKITAAPTS